MNLARISAAVVLTCGVLVGGAEARRAECNGETPTDYVADPAKVAVYNFNIHKMVDRWDLWIRAIEKSDRPIPELLLIQDLAATKRARFLCALGRAFGSTYRARSVGNETAGGVLERAVVWRASRFSLVRSRALHGWGGQEEACTLGANNAGIAQVRLKDEIATVARERTTRVGAASFKTPPPPGDGCVWKNTKFVTEALKAKRWSGDLIVFGADENTPDRDPVNATVEWVWECWYRGTNHELDGDGCTTTAGDDWNRRFTDVIYAMCISKTSPDLGTCLAGEWTRVSKQEDPDGGFVKKRIDFLFAKVPGGGAAETSGAETIPLGTPDCAETPGGNEHCYSDHRAIRAYVHY